jgi:hypothetical protein
MMKQIAWITFMALAGAACGDTGTSDGRPGAGGTGGATGTGGTSGTGGMTVVIPANVDQACRDFCGNEPGGLTCGPDADIEGFSPGGGTTQYCYENSCLRTYENTDAACRDKFIEILQCHTALECDDMFGDCDSHAVTYYECTQTESYRRFCADNCPHLDEAACVADRTECNQFLSAGEYCDDRCPTQDRNQCIQQRMSTGTCELRDATSSCREFCSQQDLSQCIEQLRSTSRCDFDNNAVGACALLCPPAGGYNFLCVAHWEQYNQCPFTDEITTCTLTCISGCPVAGIDAGQEFEQCVTSCEQLYPNGMDCAGEAFFFQDCVPENGCGNCNDPALALTACLTGG